MLAKIFVIAILIGLCGCSTVRDVGVCVTTRACN